MLYSEPTLGLSPEGLYLTSAGKILRAEFQQIFHQLSRCIFNMLMHQNKCVGQFGIILWFALLVYFYLGSGSNAVFVICSLHFLSP